MSSIVKPLGGEQADPTVPLEPSLPVIEEKAEPTSHAEALKSTSIIGGSTVIVMLIRILRTKVLAILLGPGGDLLPDPHDFVASLLGEGVYLPCAARLERYGAHKTSRYSELARFLPLI